MNPGELSCDILYFNLHCIFLDFGINGVQPLVECKATSCQHHRKIDCKILGTNRPLDTKISDLKVMRLTRDINVLGLTPDVVVVMH